MSEANKLQVGGRHYKTSYEHWDMLIDFGRGPDYLIGQTTKYVTRWRKKNGMQDLQKALHFVNKLIECSDYVMFNHFEKRTVENLLVQQKHSLEQYAQVNDLNEPEAKICELLVRMNAVEDLYVARTLIVELMEQWDRDHPVPLEDSNKHAERAT